MSRIFLLCPIGRDTRLLRHWLRHYSGFDFDGILISVHVLPEWGSGLVDEVRALGSEYGATVADVHTDKLMLVKSRRERMVARYCDDTDWIVMADSDEFHEYPVTLRSMVEHCQAHGYDYVRGTFLDRVGPLGEFLEIDDRPVWDRYPVGVHLTRNILRGNPFKVVLARSGTRVVDGQHTALGRGCPDDWVNITVHHFKWDTTVIERSRYMVWQYSLDGHPWFEEPRRFLQYMQDRDRLDLDDAALEAYWPRYERVSPWRPESGTRDCGAERDEFDPVFARPVANPEFRLRTDGGRRSLTGPPGSPRMELDSGGAAIWELADGSLTLAQITDALIARDPGWHELSEQGIQAAVRSLAHHGALSWQ